MDAVMANKQFFAFIAVLALLAVNIGGYYFLWPVHTSPAANGAGKANEAKGETRLVAGKTDKKANTESPPPKTAAADLNPPAKKTGNNDDDVVSKLLEHIRRDNEEAKTPRPLPALPSAPLIDLAASIDIAKTSGITPKVALGLWFTRVERTGTRAVLTAKLRHPGSDRIAAEFVIQCDRVESIAAPVETLVAHGAITFRGPAIKGACGKLTIPLHESRLYFDEHVQIRSESGPAESLPGILVGERLMWEPIASQPAPPAPVAPVSLGPPH